MSIDTNAISSVIYRQGRVVQVFRNVFYQKLEGVVFKLGPVG